MQSNQEGEYYLTDIVALTIGKGLPVVTSTARKPEECLGINTVEQLNFAETILRAR